MRRRVYHSRYLDLFIDDRHPVVSVVQRRRWLDFDVSSFSADLAASMLIIEPPVDVTELFACYNKTLLPPGAVQRLLNADNNQHNQLEDVWSKVSFFLQEKPAS